MRAIPAAAAVTMVLAAGCGGTPDPAPPAPAPASTGAYAVEQAARGRAAFRQSCAVCHATADFRGRDFAWRWRRQTAWDLYRRIATTMPFNDPGGLPEQAYTDVTAYILSLNGYPSGMTELIASERAMAAIALGPQRGS